MNIFISQSGDLSRKIAEIFSEWIKSYFKNTKVFVSSNTIDGGKIWFENILENLREADFAISILTKENHSKPWINYEYGALVEILRSKEIDTSKIVPILFGFEPNELNGEPIQQYQCVIWPDKEKIRKMLLSIKSLNKNEIDDSDFLTKFEEYETKINSLMKSNFGSENQNSKNSIPKISEEFLAAANKIFTNEQERRNFLDLYEYYITEFEKRSDYFTIKLFAEKEKELGAEKFIKLLDNFYKYLSRHKNNFERWIEHNPNQKREVLDLFINNIDNGFDIQSYVLQVK